MAQTSHPTIQMILKQAKKVKIIRNIFQQYKMGGKNASSKIINRITVKKLLVENKILSIFSVCKTVIYFIK